MLTQFRLGSGRFRAKGLPILRARRPELGRTDPRTIGAKTEAFLGNQARADAGLTRAAMLVAMAAIFVVALAIPEAWQDAPGGVNGPLIPVTAYFLRAIGPPDSHESLASSCREL